ncbi:hypothetical protein [Methylocella silvestris]|uniref:hypothetical protein n=1 Tax=Methylocella silvestris TaxID=199596 RepID=UPI0011D13205|nr:hypothetical protein [Methylocella silvestris]
MIVTPSSGETVPNAPAAQISARDFPKIGPPASRVASTDPVMASAIFAKGEGGARAGYDPNRFAAVHLRHSPSFHTPQGGH